ncbi:MAG: hypothetical protein Q8L81_07515 [Bacteroidota bacterium]|nr:hypothetical protein [Bacteroidota bacterium]
MDRNIFDNHAAYNRYLSIEGNRPSETYTKPSLYICDSKMKKAFKELSDEEIKIIFKNPAAQILGIRKYREQLGEKLNELVEWQTFNALVILFSEGNFECAKFILKSHWEDTCPFEDETDLYRLISKKW